MPSNTAKIVIHFSLLAIEGFVLLVFTFYTQKYIKQFKEKLDPYTMVTFLLIGFSLLVKVSLKLPPMIILQVYYSVDDPEYKQWVEKNVYILNNLQIIAENASTCLYNIALEVSALRWAMLILSYRHKSLKKRATIIKMVYYCVMCIFIGVSILLSYQQIGYFLDYGEAIQISYYTLFVTVSLMTIITYICAGCFFAQYYTTQVINYSECLTEQQIEQLEHTIKALKKFFIITVFMLLLKSGITLSQDFASEDAWVYTLLIVQYFSEMMIIILLCLTLKESIRNKKKHETLVTEIDDQNMDESSLNNEEKQDELMDQSSLLYDLDLRKTFDIFPNATSTHQSTAQKIFYMPQSIQVHTTTRDIRSSSVNKVKMGGHQSQSEFASQEII